GVRARLERDDRRAAQGGAGVQPVPGATTRGGAHGARRVLSLGGGARAPVHRRRVGLPVRNDESLAYRARRTDVSGAWGEPRPAALWARRRLEPRGLVPRP